MRIAHILTRIFAVVALMLVLGSGNSQGPSAAGDEADQIGMSQPDISDVHPAEEPLIVPPPGRDMVVIDRCVPTSRVSPLEVFRPPQARA
jgi:hypothetical protein